MKIEVDIPLRSGFELTGEFRFAAGDEYWTDGAGRIHQCSTNFSVFIVRPEKRKVIRFVQDPEGIWLESLEGIFKSNYPQQYSPENRYRREEREE